MIDNIRFFIRGNPKSSSVHRLGKRFYLLEWDEIEGSAFRDPGPRQYICLQSIPVKANIEKTWPVHPVRKKNQRLLE